MTWQEVSPEWVPLGTVKGPPGDTIALVPYSFQGPIAPRVGESPLPIFGDYVIDHVVAAVGTGPSGTPAVIDVNVNGTSIYTDQTQRPTITPGTRLAAGGHAAHSTVTDDDLLTVDVDDPGAVPAADLTVTIWLRRVPAHTP